MYRSEEENLSYVVGMIRLYVSQIWDGLKSKLKDTSNAICSAFSLIKITMMIKFLILFNPSLIFLTFSQEKDLPEKNFLHISQKIFFTFQGDC